MITMSFANFIMGAFVLFMIGAKIGTRQNLDDARRHAAMLNSNRRDR